MDRDRSGQPHRRPATVSVPPFSSFPFNHSRWPYVVLHLCPSSFTLTSSILDRRLLHPSSLSACGYLHIQTKSLSDITVVHPRFCKSLYGSLRLQVDNLASALIGACSLPSRPIVDLGSHLISILPLALRPWIPLSWRDGQESLADGMFWSFLCALVWSHIADVRGGRPLEGVCNQKCTTLLTNNFYAACRLRHRHSETSNKISFLVTPGAFHPLSPFWPVCGYLQHRPSSSATH